MAYQARVVTVVQGPCIMPGLVRTSPTGAAVPGGHDTIPFCPGKALPIRHRRNSTSSRRRNGAKGMVLVTQTSPTSVALRCVVFARSSSSKCGTSEGQQGQQFGLLGEITLLPEEGDRITCISLMRHDSNGATGYLLWIGTSNGTLLVINAAPTAYPAGCYSRIALVCQLHQKAPSLNPKQFSVDQGHEAVVAICPGTAGTPSLRNPWSVAGDGTPISNNGAVYTRSVDVLHQSGWLVSFDEEQIETLIASTTPRATSPQAIDRLSLLHEWGLVQHAHTTTHRGVSSSATTDSIPVACASGAVRDVMKRCVGHLLESSRGGAEGGSSDLGTTAAACALLPVPG
ncbi:GPI-anchored surface protein, putative, partial [Bodo saltans]